MRDGKPLILCVDDDADLLDLLRRHLEKGGYAVDTAPTAEEGLLRFKQETPDLIIADLMMEEIDAGTNLVKELKLAGNKAPIFMLSSMGDQLDVATGYQQLGLDGVFQKPVNAEALLRTIKAKLSR
jgi:DNA-binding response OmpR family regulator